MLVTSSFYQALLMATMSCLRASLQGPNDGSRRRRLLVFTAHLVGFASQFSHFAFFALLSRR